MNCALILAGGQGLRSGSEIPKQFVKVNNKPLIIYTLEKFNNCSSVDRIAVVCVKNWIEKLKKYAEEFGINKLDVVCEGGITGLDSLKKGVQALKCNQDDYILIHDAVRPFITDQVIIDNIKQVHKKGVALAAVECVETLVKSNENGYSDEMIPRDNLFRIQTPQSFKVEILNNTLNQVDVLKCKEPSVFALYMSMGNPIYCSQGSERNIKITYPDDLIYFKKLLDNN